MLNELIEVFAKQHSKRFTKKQKEQYVVELDKVFEEMDYKKEEMEKRQTIFKTKNIVYGNLKMAKNVIVVPYDTPARIFWNKYNYFPLDGNKTSTKSIMASYGPLLIFYVLFLALMYLTPMLGIPPIVMFFLSALTFILFILLFLMLIFGYPNKYNYNRNSSGVITAIELAQGLSKDQRRSTAFVFTDRNENKMHGSQLVASKLLELGKNTNVIILNCVAHGSKIVMGYTKENRKVTQDIIKCNKAHRSVGKVEMNDNMRFQNPISYFKRAVSITAGEYDDKNNLVIKNLNRKTDTIIEEENIEVIVEMLRKYIATL